MTIKESKQREKTTWLRKNHLEEFLSLCAEDKCSSKIIQRKVREIDPRGSMNISIIQ